MRRIRPIPAPPDVLGLPGSAGAKERAAAIVHFGRPDWQALEADKRTRFRFKAYNSDGVKEALQEAFHQLCAYCETPYTPGTGGDIEHYRPKGAVDTPTQRRRPPGYYWLASTWENLLPSCTRCNRGEDLEQASGSTRVSGKGNAFPLVDESTRAAGPGGETLEQPLLLHPYDDDPDVHLAFVGELATARDGDARGAATIEVLGLNRLVLIDARRDHLVQVEAALKRIAKLERKIEQYPDDQDFRDDLAQEEIDLKAMVAAGKPYSAAVAHRLGIDRHAR
jgi:uncharacterized protein (TIGR02646 family)